MCRRAKSDAAGDGVGDMEETADGFADDISEDPGRDDGGDRDGDIAAELFGKSHADGRGDGLGKQRHVGSVVKAEGQAEDVDGKEPCHDAGKDTEEDGLIVFLQKLDLFIERHGETDGGGRQQVIDVGGAFVIVLVIHAGHLEEADDQEDRGQKRIEQGKMKFQKELRAEIKGDEADEDRDVGGVCQEIIHGRSPSW